MKKSNYLTKKSTNWTPRLLSCPRRNCKISGNPARRAHKNCVHSASEPLRMLSKTSLRFIEWTMRFDPKRLAFGVEITRMLRQNCAKEMQKFPKKIQRAARTRSCVHSACVCCDSHDIFESLHQVMSALTSEQARVRRRDHANFAPKSREKVAKFPEFRRTARTKFACIRPTYVSQTAESSLHLFTESAMR